MLILVVDIALYFIVNNKKIIFIYKSKKTLAF